MSLKYPTGGNRQLPPPGNHVARLAQIIDLGKQDSKRYKPSPQVRLTWELSEELGNFGKSELEPFLISRTLGFSFDKKAHLPKILEGMNGGPLTEEQKNHLETTLRNMIGAPCMINVIHVRVDDKTFANVEAVTPVPTKLKKNVPPLRNKGIFFELDMGPNSPEFQALPDFLKSIIAKSHEWSNRGAVQPDEEDEDDNGQQTLKFG